MFAALPPDLNTFVLVFVEAAAFGLLGIVLLALGFKVFEKITPKLDVEGELAKGNVAVGMMVAAVLLGLSVIVAVCVG